MVITPLAKSSEKEVKFDHPVTKQNVHAEGVVVAYFTSGSQPLLRTHCKSGSFEKYLNQLYSTDQIAMVWFCENHH
jgi:hypothetical protein